MKGKKEYKLNQLLFIDDLKLFSKSEEQWKCGILTMERGKVVRGEEIKPPNSEVMKEVEKGRIHVFRY